MYSIEFLWFLIQVIFFFDIFMPTVFFFYSFMLLYLFSFPFLGAAATASAVVVIE